MAFKLSNFPYKYLVLLLLLGLVVWAMPWLIHGPQVTVVEARRADLVQSLVASGRVESPHRVEVGVQMTAQVASVLVSEGDQLLFKQGFISVAAQEDADRALQLATSQQQTAELQLKSVQAGGSERTAIQAAWMAAQDAALSAPARLSYTQVTAPVAGTLIARHVEPGDMVQAGKALLVLSPKGQVQLVLQIDEKNLRFLRLKQSALASADAYEDQRFDAEVVFINPSVDPLRGSVEVKLNVLHPPGYLREDMTVSVDMAVDRRENALLLPMSAVHDLHNRAWVNVVRGGRVVAQPLQLGLGSGGVVQVLSGVTPGEQVIASTLPSWKPQTRVRPVVQVSKL